MMGKNMERRTQKTECGSREAFTLVELPAVSKRACDPVELPAVSRRGFTLVELLAVIAIMTILFIVAVPSLETFTRKGLSTSIAPLTTTLRLARQYAVTHREHVYVVFPDDDDTAYTGSDIDRALRSYAVIASNASGAYYVSDWRYLPRGVAFDPNNAITGSVFRVAAGTSMLPFPSENSSPQPMPSIHFRPNGRASWAEGGGTVNDVLIPITSTIYFDVSTNPAQLSALSRVAGDKIGVSIRGMTGQVFVRYVPYTP